MTVAPVQPADTRADATTLAGARHADTAVELLTALLAVPVGHPSRPGLRAKTIEAWLPLARHLANRYTGRGEPADDLIQTATIGLIKAIDRYDPNFGVEFGGFAIPTIVGELKRHFRDRAWSIRVPRRLQELRIAITTANNTLTHTLGRSPTVADIAAHLGVTDEDVLEGLEGARAYSTTSLSAPISGHSATELADTLGDDDHGFELTELRIALVPAMAALDERGTNDPDPAVLRQSDPGRDRRAGRHLTDARLAPDHPGVASAACSSRPRQPLNPAPSRMPGRVRVI